MVFSIRFNLLGALERVNLLFNTTSDSIAAIARRAIIPAIAVMLLAGGIYYFIREEPLPPPKSEQAEIEPSGGGSLTFTEGSIVEKQNNRLIWQLNAGNIISDFQAKKVYLSKVSGVFYREDKNNEQVDLVAEEASLDTVTKMIELKNEVKITGDGGASLTAPAAKWYGDERKFEASGGIVFSRDDIVITGESVEAVLDLGKVVVKGKARVVKGGKRDAEK